MRFSPLLISSLIVLPLRYFFANYTGEQGLVWSDDEKTSTIEIGTVNDYHTKALERKPRVLINRGGYNVDKTGITDNLAQSKSIGELKGNSERVNMVWIRGVAQIIIESREEGACELISDMVSHFIVWSRPLLCDTQGFKEFGLGMSVSDCSPDKDDIEKFKVTISIPYMMEEHWQVNQEALKLKSFFTHLDPFTKTITSEPIFPGVDIITNSLQS